MGVLLQGMDGYYGKGDKVQTTNHWTGAEGAGQSLGWRSGRDFIKKRTGNPFTADCDEINTSSALT